MMQLKKRKIFEKIFQIGNFNKIEQRGNESIVRNENAQITRDSILESLTPKSEKKGRIAG